MFNAIQAGGESPLVGEGFRDFATEQGNHERKFRKIYY